MKKITKFLLLLLLVALALSCTALAADPAEFALYDISTGQYTDTTVYPVGLEVNGQTVETDLQPFILNERTLVPIRVISENLGANVDWNGDTKQITITTAEKTIVLTLGSAEAQVNGETVELPDGVAPTLVQVEGGSRTVVPVRFVSEQLGALVEWDSEARIVRVSAVVENDSDDADSEVGASGDEITTGKITAIAQDGHQVLVTADAAVTPTVFTLEGRIVVDLPGLLVDMEENSGSLTLTDLAATEVRYSQYDADYEGYDHVARLVFDLQEDASEEDLSVAWGGTTLVCSLTAYSEISNESSSDADPEDTTDTTADSETDSETDSKADSETDSESDSDAETDSELSTKTESDSKSETETNSESTQKTEEDAVTETTGTDGSTQDTSATTTTVAATTSLPASNELPEDEPATDETGKPWAGLTVDPSRVSILLDAGHGGSDPGCQYYGADEKDITLAVTLKLGAILEEQGYQVFYTRTDDTYVSLEDRSDMANALDVTLFVSIHVNAADNTSAHGLETYYWTQGTSAEKSLASCVHAALIAATGANNREVRTANYWVCRKTDMPAILVETGFLSNYSEYLNLTSSSYQQKLAQGVANGLATYLAQTQN